MQNSTANVSYVEFTLVPFPGLQELRPFLALPFFCLFLLIVATNSVVIYTVKTEESLHSPMCLLIALLLAVNLIGTFAILPRMLFSLVLPASHISLTECLVQMFFLYFTILLDCNVLLMMALDRFLATCHPLRYAELMTIKLLSFLTLLSLLRSLGTVGPVVVLASRVRFCRSNVIGHFACEHMAVMGLSCGNISVNKRAGLALRFFDFILDFSLLLASYGRIVHTALKISSGHVRHKLFRTCGTHWIVIVISYSSRLSSSIVFRLAQSAPQDVHNLISATYLLFPWTVHPLIYGMRTKEIKAGLQKLFPKK
ncbi:olfactory receptor 52K1-like [Pseudonaja textilis]|uniref:olfactory receptor 52K1-like n=1 Tax=Pseudonaja textilis TaxID=8673 RepID=UPI000EA9298D|nr:olfactory receptor 52K1-like [Pseudonaja textilis]